MSNQDSPVTLADLRSMKNEIVDEISTVLSDAMTNIGFSLKQLDYKVVLLNKDVETLKDSQYRIEQKLDPTVKRLDDHSVRIAQLKQISA